jgi:hypothetical protein
MLLAIGSLLLERDGESKQRLTGGVGGRLLAGSSWWCWTGVRRERRRVSQGPSALKKMRLLGMAVMVEEGKLKD